jgi:rhodanese-related sulfurtransferase
MVLVLLLSLFFGFVLLGERVGSETSILGLDAQTRIIKDITPKEAFTLIKNNRPNSSFVILDVRTPQEFREERLSGAINLDYYSRTFRNDLDKLDKDKTYLIYCYSGMRSGATLNLMKKSRFKEVYNILGGILAWKADGLPSIQ